MSTKYKIFLAILSLLALILMLSSQASAQAPAPSTPDGFYLIDDAPGVSMYRKDYPNGSPDYVQVVDLSQGAKVVAMHGEVRETRSGKGAYGGNDARIQSQSLNKFWNQLSAAGPDPFCVVNGQFFYMPESPTRLPFPLKVDGNIVSDGYGINEFPDQKLMLELWPNRADIVSLTHESLYSSDAPNIVAGLSQTAKKRIDRYVGRTFVGVDDQDLDGNYETVFIFNSSLARQADAAEVLESFGADKVMMLDGGGSTQLLCGGEAIIYSERLIPQALGVIASQGIPTVEAVQASPVATVQPPTIAMLGAPENAGEAIIQAPAEQGESMEAASSLPDAPPVAVVPAAASAAAQPFQVRLSDVLYVPLMMSPVLAFLLFFINKLRMGAG